jgi:hypothetical protein
VKDALRTTEHALSAFDLHSSAHSAKLSNYLCLRGDLIDRED